MPDFRELQQEIQETRHQRQQTGQALFRARERLKRIAEQKKALQRYFDPENEAHRAEVQRLETLQRRVMGEIDQLQTSLSGILEEERARLDEFEVFADPREHLGHLDDRFPFLLFPLRLETRFKEVGAGEERRRQLWVRIFPDDAVIDTFEETLSEVEVENARQYWVNLWKAGGIEAQERGAWRSLAGSHGSGRAYYIIRQYEPVNPKDQPAKDKPEDLILIVTVEEDIAAAEREAIRSYWIACWQAGKDKALQEEAFESLKAAVGEARAQEINEQLRPSNLSYEPPAPVSREEVEVQLVFLQFPSLDATDTKEQSWSRAPKVHVMPDRFVLLGFQGEEQVLERIGDPVPSPLIVGPDPLASEEDGQFDIVDGNLKVGDTLKWMVDFEEAIRIGMGFKVDLTPEQARSGFDRLFVIGLRLSADEVEGKTHLEELFTHHQQSKKGFSLMPQGTPTNNTEKVSAGLSRLDDPDVSFDNFFVKGDLFTETDDPMAKLDGHWLAEYLGVDPAIFKKTYNADGRDQCEARAMNTALWPATLGYFMETMMQPVFSEAAIEKTRAFFRLFVQGRGAVPAIRIGRQPYGILPTAAYSRLQWINREEPPPTTHGRPVAPLGFGYLRGLYGILGNISTDWSAFREEVAYVGKSGDPHQILLDVLGLHATSVEFYQRYAESFQQLYNRLNLQGVGGAFLALLIAAGYVESGMELLRRLGYDDSEAEDGVPDLLEKFFLKKANLLKKALIDDGPLSQTDPIRNYTTDDRNYIGWLIQAATTSHDALRKQEGFIDGLPPHTLLYLMLRYALDQGYFETSLRLHQRAEVLSGPEVQQLKREPSFLYVDDDSALSGESKWRFLYRRDTQITDDPELLIGDFIPRIYEEDSAARHFKEQIEGLRHLEHAPTARLERAFAEHLDCCTCRLDAWKQGVLHYQLDLARQLWGTAPPVKGTYLGAYGWLEEVRPGNKDLRPIALPEDLQGVFDREGEAPLFRDSTNAGYIHAPSLNHAVTAAVLRNGYLSNATPSNPETLSVNLSSGRVRLALSFIEGIRNGQNLGALLGYQLERGLHDRYMLQLDQFIYELRKAFPLVADRLATTRTGGDVPIREIEARNVVDGLALINHIKNTGERNYPFGKELPTEDISDAQREAIDQEVDQLLNIHDAIADLALAESVHQVVQNNYDRAGATLDAYSKGDYPPEPEVVRTPRSGLTLTHRVGVHLEAGLAPGIFPDSSPRAMAEPGLNKWLTQLLPAPAEVACTVRFFDAATEAEVTHTITQADLELQPLDLLFVLQTGDEQAMTILDDHILHHTLTAFEPRPDTVISIEYVKEIPGKVSFFELAPLLRSLRRIALESRPLRPADVLLPDEATREEEQKVSLDRRRVQEPQEVLQDLLDNQVAPLLAAIDPLVNVEDVAANTAAVIAALDSWIEDFVAAAVAAGRFGMTLTGAGDFYSRRRSRYQALVDRVEERVERWEDKLSQYDILITDYLSLPSPATDVEKFEILQRAEHVISTDTTDPLPAAPEDFKADILDGKRSDFAEKKDDLAAILETTAPTIHALRDEILAQTLLTDFDLLELDLGEEDHRLLTLAKDLFAQLQNLKTEIESRLGKTQEQLDLHDAATEAPVQVKALQDAGKALLGDDFVMAPSFVLPSERAGEWENAWNGRHDLLAFQKEELNMRFPVDDWLYGTARVREKIHDWENLTFLTEGFDAAATTEVELTPLQLPYREDDRWLALQYEQDGEEFDPGGHRLLYTAHYSVPFDKSKPQCGLLMDEWTEVIPTMEETTGITFHFDRPNSEPPQVMLMVMPTDFRGSWQWPDIVDALHETLDMAKERAIEPRRIEKGAYARFLPATISAVTVHPITIALNYAFNNQVYAQLNLDSDE
jgi:hypothetical protein